MPMVFNEGEYNMPSIAGQVILLTEGHDLPIPVKVSGLRAGRRYDITLSEDIPNLGAIRGVLQEKGYTTTIAEGFREPYTIGLSRNLRENYKACAVIISFIMFVMHETIVIDNAKYVYQNFEEDLEDFEDEEPEEF